MSDPAPKPRGFSALAQAMTSWRTASVSLLSFSSGLPLGLVLFAIPDWMRSIGVDIRVVGLITLAQAPWSFKMLWSPFMDRWTPPFFGRRRGWAAIAQVGLLALGLLLAGVGGHPDTPWVVGALTLAIAFASATQDIAIDAYAVDVLHEDEQGIAVGARTALYRMAMFVAGGAAITAAKEIGWPAVNVILAALYLPMLVITWRSPEPEETIAAPKTLREAVWLPFLGFLSRHRSLEILAFVVFYKLADNLGQALVSPFLIDMGYVAFDRGVARTTIGLFATVIGTFAGGAWTTVMGLGRSLWIFGLLQIVSNVGYVLVASQPPSRPLMYGALGFESFTTGLGTGAFFVLLLRLTQKRFSATQYALFSSLFGVPRIVSGPICGFMVDAIGWRSFFLFTIAAGIPGMILLARFVPWGVREPQFDVEPPKHAPVGFPGLLTRGILGAAAGTAFAAATWATLDALKAMRGVAGASFDLGPALHALAAPADVPGWLATAGVLVFGAICGLFAAAVAAARGGEVPS